MRAFGLRKAPTGAATRLSNSLDQGFFDDEAFFDEPLADAPSFVPPPVEVPPSLSSGAASSRLTDLADVPRGESLDHLFSHSSKLPPAAAAAVAPARTELLDLLPDVLSPSRSRSASFEFVAAAGGDGDGDDDEGEEVARQRRYTPSPPPQQSPQSRRPPSLSHAGSLWHDVSEVPASVWRVSQSADDGNSPGVPAHRRTLVTLERTRTPEGARHTVTLDRSTRTAAEEAAAAASRLSPPPAQQRSPPVRAAGDAGRAALARALVASPAQEWEAINERADEEFDAETEAAAARVQSAYRGRATRRRMSNEWPGGGGWPGGNPDFDDGHDDDCHVVFQLDDATGVAAVKFERQGDAFSRVVAAAQGAAAVLSRSPSRKMAAAAEEEEEAAAEEEAPAEEERPSSPTPVVAVVNEGDDDRFHVQIQPAPPSAPPSAAVDAVEVEVIEAADGAFRVDVQPHDAATASPVLPAAAPAAAPAVATPARSPLGSPARSPVRSPVRSPAAAPAASPIRSPAASPVRSPAAAPAAAGPGWTQEHGYCVHASGYCVHGSGGDRASAPAASPLLSPGRRRSSSSSILSSQRRWSSSLDELDDDHEDEQQPPPRRVASRGGESVTARTTAATTARAAATAARAPSAPRVVAGGHMRPWSPAAASPRSPAPAAATTRRWVAEASAAAHPLGTRRGGGSSAGGGSSSRAAAAAPARKAGTAVAARAGGDQERATAAGAVCARGGRRGRGWRRTRRSPCSSRQRGAGLPRACMRQTPSRAPSDPAGGPPPHRPARVCHASRHLLRTASRAADRRGGGRGVHLRGDAMERSASAALRYACVGGASPPPRASLP